jgi:hypothetical protein
MSGSSHESRNKGATVAVGVLGLLLFGGSAFLTLLMWGLGVGVDRTFHNLMGWIFLGIHAACFAMVCRALTARRHGVAVLFSIAPALLSLATLVAFILGCSLLGRC